MKVSRFGYFVRSSGAHRSEEVVNVNAGGDEDDAVRDRVSRDQSDEGDHAGERQSQERDTASEREHAGKDESAHVRHVLPRPRATHMPQVLDKRSMTFLPSRLP